MWDGNEVWVLVAGGATFAAFPEWYATLFSGFYLPLLLILVALIVRGLAFEYRAKRDDASWRRAGTGRSSSARSCRPCCGAWRSPTSCAACPIDADLEYTGGFFNLLNPYALLGGVTTLLLFLTHGAMFISLKTDGRIRHAARGACRSTSASARPSSAVAFLALDPGADRHGLAPRSRSSLAAVALVAGLAAVRRRPGGLGVHRHVRRHRRSAVAGLFLGPVPRRDADHDSPTASP